MDTFGVEHLTLPLGHAGHWITGFIYFAPVAGFLIWLGIVTVRDRREDEKER